MFEGLAERFVKNSYHDKETDTLFLSNPGISFTGLKALAKKHGFTIGQTKSGNFVSIPTAFKYSKNDFDTVSMYDDFMSTYTYYDKNFSTLLSAYSTFDVMEENLSEVDLMLNTYVAEVLGQGFIDNPLSIKISNQNAQNLVEAVLYKNKIYERLPSIVKSLAKYGNFGLILSYPYLEQWIQDEKSDFKAIDVIEDLVISFVNPKDFKVNVDDYGNVINYETMIKHNFTSPSTATSTAKLNNRIWQPWQFTHFLLWDESTDPYGKSMLWSMRSAFDQLTTLEALLAISRAGKVQRLVFYVPLPNGVSTIDAYGFMNEFKGQYLNSIFADQGSAKAGRKLPGAMSILTLPVSADGKKVEVDKIPECDIDLGSTEDVQYFLDKILRASNLPKGYLVGDDVITTAQALEAQDLKLRRTLMPLKKGLINGIMNLVENILTHAGYNVAKLDVEVGLNEPIQMSADLFEKYGKIIELLGGFLELNPTMTNVNKFQMLVSLGLPSNLARLALSSSSINVISNPNDLSKFLIGQKTRNEQMIQPVNNDGGDMGESIVHRINSKQYLAENYNHQNNLKNVYDTLKTETSVDLKESLFRSTKGSLNE